MLAVDAIRGVPLGQDRVEMFDQVYEESLSHVRDFLTENQEQLIKIAQT